MTTQKLHAGQASTEIKRSASKSERLAPSSAAAEAINQPRPDWVAPWEAPFYCFSNGYMHSPREWADALKAEAQKIIQSDIFVDALQTEIQKLLEAESIEAVGRPEVEKEWSFAETADVLEARITAMDLTTRIAPGYVYVVPINSDPSFDYWLAGGSSDEILDDRAWNEEFAHADVSLDRKIAAQWHRRLLRFLFSSWKWSFAEAIKTGSAHIMARKHSILAPFERITWNQWQYFRLEGKIPPAPPQNPKWGDPRPLYRAHQDLPWTAVGPADETLYDIHIAPGENKARSTDLTRKDGPEERCMQWLMDAIRNYPERPPKPRDLLAEEAISKFPGLSRNGFFRSFARAQIQTQNHNWSRPGRFPKSPQKSLHSR
jgi:hypothetical protein